MAEYAQEREFNGEAVDHAKEDLKDDDGVDEALEELFGQDGMFFYKLGEVVES